VTTYVGWPAHKTVDDTRAFLAFSESYWEKWPAGAYLAWSRETGELLGSTGLVFETPLRAATGYVFARRCVGPRRRERIAGRRGRCGPERWRSAPLRAVPRRHRASARVLEKCGFSLEDTLRRYVEFPNLRPGDPQDVRCYATILENASGTERENCS